MVVEGAGAMVSRDPDAGNGQRLIHMSKGMCVRTPMGITHAFYAITPVTAIALLTKKWDDCHPPIVREDLINPPS